jgi:hypothetical protein
MEAMSPKEFEKVMQELCGGIAGSPPRLAAMTGISQSTICRWRKGQVPISSHNALLLRLLLVLKRRRINWRKWVNECNELNMEDLL